MTTRNFYAILKLPSPATCSSADIKRAYKCLVLLHHPDKDGLNVEAATKKFKLIQEAYDTLSDEGKRRAYDAAQGMNRHQHNTNRSGASNPPPEKPTRPRWSPFSETNPDTNCRAGAQESADEEFADEDSDEEFPEAERSDGSFEETPEERKIREARHARKRQHWLHQRLCSNPKLEADCQIDGFLYACIFCTRRGYKGYHMCASCGIIRCKRCLSEEHAVEQCHPENVG